ncbi:DNA methylase N-4/N-6 domain-containing protein [Moraxella bovoculi 237]|uniref:Methyltransferase n=1 Tax=Moraxella bovoculi 237 TaxID=743974 RepID=A0A066UD99_9GAMM|nr:site-specific DNA-methyltransferase [Moraxella bovoculi]KDN25085.1 DNA methylase N-4/N-6 domain-containing protein [Moraxella bovoculi 237]
MLHFSSVNQDFLLFCGNSIKIMQEMDEKSVNMIFADPPYFLSNDGLTVKNGIIQSVNKGEWDKNDNEKEIYDFNNEWIKQSRRLLKDNGTIWISGTHHNIFSIGQVLKENNFKLLNMITWEKPNPPPNFSCRYFTYSTEWIIWARKYSKIPHYFNYDLMKKLNDNKQQKDVWRLPSVGSWEKTQGKHPTQKPLGLLARIILASTQKGDLILDPFSGSGTTGIASVLLDRNYIGIEQELEFLELSKRRYQAMTLESKYEFKQKIREQISII